MSLLVQLLGARRKAPGPYAPVSGYAPVAAAPREEPPRVTRDRPPDPVVFGPEDAVDLQTRSAVFPGLSCPACGVTWFGSADCWACPEETG